MWLYRYAMTAHDVKTWHKKILEPYAPMYPHAILGYTFDTANGWTVLNRVAATGDVFDAELWTADRGNVTWRNSSNVAKTLQPSPPPPLDVAAPEGPSSLRFGANDTMTSGFIRDSTDGALAVDETLTFEAWIKPNRLDRMQVVASYGVGDNATSGLSLAIMCPEGGGRGCCGDHLRGSIGFIAPTRDDVDVATTHARRRGRRLTEHGALATTILFPVLAGNSSATQGGSGRGDAADEVWNTMAILQTGIDDGTIPSTYGLTIDHTSLSHQDDMCDSAKVEAALHSALFLFLPDQEKFDLFVCGEATESKAVIKSWVQGGGNIFVGATGGISSDGRSNDVALLNAIFDWDLTKSTGTYGTFGRNEINAAGTVFENMGASTFNLPATQTMYANCGTSPCLPIFTAGASGTDKTQYILARWQVGGGNVFHHANNDPYQVCPIAQVTFPWG